MTLLWPATCIPLQYPVASVTYWSSSHKDCSRLCHVLDTRPLNNHWIKQMSRLMRKSMRKTKAYISLMCSWSVLQLSLYGTVPLLPKSTPLAIFSGCTAQFVSEAPNTGFLATRLKYKLSVITRAWNATLNKERYVSPRVRYIKCRYWFLIWCLN